MIRQDALLYHAKIRTHILSKNELFALYEKKAPTEAVADYQIEIINI